jgi:hypothetical protein
MAFTYKLEHEDGTPADPRTFKTAVRTGDLATRSRSAGVEHSGSSTPGSTKARTVTTSPCSWSKWPR